MVKFQANKILTHGVVPTAFVIVGWILFQKFVLNNLENTYFLYSPRELIPALYCMVLITGMKIGLAQLTKNAAVRFASTQVKVSIPKWCSNPEEYANDTKNGTITPLTSKQIYDILNKSKIDDSDKEFEAECREYNLTKVQIVDLKRYRKAKAELADHISKYQEICFKLLAAFVITMYGSYVVLIRENFFWNPSTQWVTKKPPQNYDKWLTYYYIIALGYHLHRTMYQFFETVRKDFWAMFIHHWATIALVTISWLIGFMQSGALVMFLHDNGDLWLSLGKLFRYNGWKIATDVTFIIFTISWVVFRLYWFATKVLYSTFTEGFEMVRPYPYAWTCISLLCLLQILHIYWFGFILVIIKNMLLKGAVDDVRSGVSENENNKKKRKHED